MRASPSERSPLDPRDPYLGRAPLDPRAILTSIGEAVYDWDLATDAIAWGVNAKDVLGLGDMGRLASGHAFSLAVEPDSGVTRHDAVLRSEAVDSGSGVPYRTRYALRLSADRLVVLEDSGRWYADATGQAAFAHGVVRIDRSAGADDARARAKGGDRTSLLAEIKGEVADAVRSRRALTLFVAAVEDIATVNHTFGDDIGDAVLEEVARRLRSVVRRRDRLVRYSGNRFATALMSCTTQQAQEAARRLADAVASTPVQTAAGPLAARIRLGAAVAPDHALDPVDLLRRAESALASAKQGLSHHFVLFDPAAAPRGSSGRGGTPALDVVDALNDRRLAFARQPVVEAHSRATAFSEALVRIRGADGRIIGAGDILPSVERAGLGALLDTRMLELAADYLALHPSERLAINVSPLTIAGGDWLSRFAAHLGAHPGIAARLIVEITETAIIADPHATRARLEAMKALGVAIAIDDFGAGHTSFKHLRHFPVDLLKIDGAFVPNLARSTDDRFFVRTLIDLAHHLGIATVAEWVEDEETARLLASWGVDYLQGDHCGRPVLAGSGIEQPVTAAA